MKLGELFFKAYRYLTYRGILNFEKSPPDVSNWYKFLSKIPEPYDDIERTYCRYRCRMYYFSFFYRVLADVASFFAFVISIPIFFQKKQFINDNEKTTSLIIVKASNVGYKDIIPEELIAKYPDYFEVGHPPSSKWFLSKDARGLLKKMFLRRPFHLHLNYWAFRELCMYSYLIDTYSPNAIAIYVNERNVVAPVLSHMCENRGIDLVSFMHGDYILQLIHGFMRFTRFYVWDQHYVDMFTNDLRCANNQFVFYKPKKLQGLCKPKSSDNEYEFYGTYYFGAESKKRIHRVAKAFKKLKDKGLICKVRPHPRRSDIEEIKTAFNGFFIEDPQLVSLSQSLESSKYIIALYSTVLSEAYYSGKEIVIDDFSEVDKYNSLKERKFIMLSKPHKLLSHILDV